MTLATGIRVKRTEEIEGPWAGGLVSEVVDGSGPGKGDQQRTEPVGDVPRAP